VTGIPNDPRLAAGELLYLAAMRARAKRRALGGLAWEQTEGLCALLEAAKAAERHDGAPALVGPERAVGGGMQRLLAEARRYIEEDAHGA
jgi:hypothetical protein